MTLIPRLYRLAGTMDTYFGAVKVDRTVIGSQGTGGDLNQCGLPGTVLSDERVNLASRDREGDIVESTHSRESLADPFELNNRCQRTSPLGQLHDQLHDQLRDEKELTRTIDSRTIDSTMIR